MSRSRRYILPLCFYACILLLLPGQLHARRIAISTDVLRYVELLTLNARLEYALHRNVTLNAGLEYNPFTWRKTAEGGNRQLQDRRRTFYLGARYWPFYVYTGWYVNVKVQYTEYSRGGILSPEMDQGDAFGMGLSLGYSFIINEWFDIELGAGLWGGWKDFSIFSRPGKGVLLEKGRKWFLLPDQLSVSMVFLF